MNIIICVLINYLGYVVSPARIDETVLGAEQITEVFEVVNFSNDSLRIKIEFEDFDINEGGEVTFLDAGSIANSVAPLATINPEEFSVGPQQTENIRVTFDFPKQPKSSEYYGMLLFKSQPIPTKYQPMIAIAGEIGVPIYFDDAELAIKNGQFEKLDVLKDTVFCIIKNTGNIHLRASGEAVLLRFDETIIEKDSIPEFVVFPGKSRNIKVPLAKKIPYGDTCIVRVRFDYGAVELIEAERRFSR